ncbi:MAG: hypothetical protein J6K25_15000 [Thermoguttaceae bacterium]|nr:hypothetical protein [Thermoguttaceae bacterium]
MSKVNISKHFAQRIAEKLREPLAPAPKGRRASSLFYDVRPARIVGEWSRNDAGLWTAKANFIVGDAVDASFEFDVAAPLALESETAPTAADATAFVVWRGRWELLSAPSTPVEPIPIRMATVAAAWTQNEARSAPIVAEYYDADLAEYVEITARSPLSRYRDSLAAGTKILVAQITSGNWILLNAECPE